MAVSSLDSIASALSSAGTAVASQAIGTSVLNQTEDLLKAQVDTLFGSFGVGQNFNGNA